MPEHWKIKRQPKTLTEGDMKESDDEDEIVTLIRNRGLVRRAIETVAAAFVVVLFLLYPTLLKVTTKMLQCRELDFGAQANAKVLIADPSDHRQLYPNYWQLCFRFVQIADRGKYPKPFKVNS